MSTLTLFKQFVLGTVITMWFVIGVYGVAFFLAAIACRLTVGCH